MGWDEPTLWRIYQRSNGMCHICERLVHFEAYNRRDNPRGWQVEHGNPVSRGGGWDLRNLKPAHIKCNVKKGAMTTNEFRRNHPNGGRSTTPRLVDSVKSRVDRFRYRQNVNPRFKKP